MRVNDRHLSLYYEMDDDLGEIKINPKKTALLVVDMQHEFLDRPEDRGNTPEEREHNIKWEQFYDAIEETVIPNNQRILEAFRDNGMEVIFAKIESVTEDGRERSLTHTRSGFNQLLIPPGEAEIVPELAPKEGEDEILLTKTTDSAVTGTNLRMMLNNMSIDTVVVTGVYTDQCVSNTVRSLSDESFDVWLIEDACRAATEELHEHELTALNNIYCHVINTDELIDTIDHNQAE